MGEKAFAAYMVKGRFNTGQVIDWSLLTPASCWKRIDLTFWQSLTDRALFTGTWTLLGKCASLAAIRQQMGQAVGLTDQKCVPRGYTPAVDRQTLFSTCGVLHNGGTVNNKVTVHHADKKDSSVLLVDKIAAFFESEDCDEEALRLAAAFAGRHVLLEEVRQVWGKRARKHVMFTLQKLYLLGCFDWDAPIARQRIGRKMTAFCQRCGYGLNTSSLAIRSPAAFSSWQRLRRTWSQWWSPEVLPRSACARCGSESCLFCPRCLQMGKVRSCEPYLKWHGGRRSIVARPEQRNVQFRWQGQLSPLQQEASKRLLRFARGESDQFLLWAVTGAGKTEIWFETIYHFLLKDKKVLVASPRRDVILELEPRLKEVFPHTTISVLHGESEQKYEAADLFLATTHQTLRFRDYFDLVIVDEEDAFPYHVDSMLPYAVQKARRACGKIVYVTATPRREMIDAVRRGEIEHVLIPRRYHGHPLPVPRLKPVGRWRKSIRQKEILTPLVQFLTELLAKNRFGYLFVPHVHLLDEVLAYMQNVILPYVRDLSPQFQQAFPMESVHAQDPLRTEKVQRFRNKQIRLLMTTTILERGVTIPFSDVAVLGSDDQVFDTAALIQIAGRVGRKADDFEGNVWFFPEQRTLTQMRAIRQIERWNRMNVPGGDLS